MSYRQVDFIGHLINRQKKSGIFEKLLVPLLRQTKLESVKTELNILNTSPKITLGVRALIHT